MHVYYNSLRPLVQVKFYVTDRRINLGMHRQKYPLPNLFEQVLVKIFPNKYLCVSN